MSNNFSLERSLSLIWTTGIYIANKPTRLQPHSHVRERIAKLWPQILDEAKANNYSTVLLVSHGGYISGLTKYLINNGHAVVSEKIPLEDIRHPPNTSITTIEVPKGSRKGVITTYSALPHLTQESKVYFKDGQ